MPGDMVKIIIDNIYNKRVPKPSNLRPGYDMEHVFKPHETPQQWANRVRGPLQELLSKREYNIPYEYRRPRVHKSEMAICFNCWKLVKITEVKLKKVYFDGYRRWGYEVESKDLMKNHWNYSCFEVKTEEVPLEPNKSYSLTSSKVTTPSMQCSVTTPPMQCSVSVPSSINTNRPGEGNTNKLFISSLFAKQINLVPFHLNLPKDTILRLRDGTEITIV
ncbi:hypothetical protein C2G38_2208752 [Gigaspora rosea]|uniref:Uncharacterized protein n=1 Tax=Gigaspora rosea TaxID=44941 RepID=A0A397UL60_9GLOM|nr:hypothetical protein C2G38_2208752 [Gigaspora rosea]